MDGEFEAVQIDVHVKGQGWWGTYYLSEDEILNDKKEVDGGFFVVSDFHRHLFNWWIKFVRRLRQKEV